MRFCTGCQTPEIRVDNRVNLDPISGLCVPCLIRKFGRQRVMPEPPKAQPFDPKLAAAGDRE